MTRMFEVGETVEFSIFVGKNSRGVVIDVLKETDLWGRDTSIYIIRYEDAYDRSSIIRAGQESVRPVPPLLQLAEQAE